MTRVLVTGAAGFVGTAFLNHPEISGFSLIACDIQPVKNLPENAEFREMDITKPEMVQRIFDETRPEIVVHLASVVTPPEGSGREFAYDVDVNGTRHVVAAALKHGCKRLVVTSSGAAYGYWEDNSTPLTEEDPIRGNYEFPYSHHKHLIEELLCKTREEHPELEQVVLRPGTVLGDNIENQITALFHKPRLLAIRNNESPFVFIWDSDLAAILAKACKDGKPGIYNVAGDNALGVTHIATILQKPVIRFPAWVIKLALAIASPLGLTQYGPEHVRFLQYRPVLDNTRLKEEFGYHPEKTTVEAFDSWRKQAGL